MSKERRVAERIPSKFEVTFVHTGDYIISHSRDISADGMFLHTNNPPNKGETTQLKFNLGKNTPLDINAIVVWANMDQASMDKGMAVQFLDTTPKEKEAILKYIRKVAILDEPMTIQ